MMGGFFSRDVSFFFFMFSDSMYKGERWWLEGTLGRSRQEYGETGRITNVYKSAQLRRVTSHLCRWSTALKASPSVQLVVKLRTLT